MNDLSGVKATVLIVEDEPAIRMLLAEYLEFSGFAVGVAANGAEGMSYCRLSRPDLLITDIDMPVMNGLELIQKVRAMDSSLPIVVISGEAAHLIAADNLGANASCVKPLDLRKFLQVVNGVLR